MTGRDRAGGRAHDLLTTVMITRNRCRQTLESLAQATGRVVLVDNGSTDGTVAAVRQSFPAVEVVALPGNHGALARNIGVERAGTPYVAFADDDSWWRPDSLALAQELLAVHPDWAVLVASVLVEPAGTLDPINEQMLAESPPVDDPLRPALGARLVAGFPACAAVVRRTAFLRAGGFDDVVFFMGEEDRLALDLASLGWGLAYVASLEVRHHPSPARDRAARRALVARNRLLTAVLRRPWPVVARELVRVLRDGASGRAGVRQAVPRLPRALARRRRVPRRVEARLRLIAAG